jgi:para-nitrobenzyl esterase
VDAVVETRSGRVRGALRRGALAFLGIPYARAAEGRLRFLPPRLPEPWPGVRECVEPGRGAPQRSALPRWLQGVAGNPRAVGEDCLRVHVFTPAADARRRPVLVWIHGGAFAFGSGSAPIYDGSALARDHDVVVVAINYRLGALGFAQLDSVARGGPFASNVGLRDQLAALAWVREHAAAFGGDPENVTLFGESAGAMSIGALLGSPLARGLFRRAICQSGAAHHVSSRDGAARMAHALLRALGLSSAQAERLCDVPLAALLDAQIRAAASVPAPWGLLPWQPAQDDDLLPNAPLDAIAAGSARGVSLLVGTNRDEYNLFLLTGAVRAMDEARLRTVIARVIGPARAGDAYALYRELLPRARPIACWSRFQTHRVFRAPAERLAELAAKHSAETYAYLFTWSPPLTPRRVGACHALEIPLVFGTHRSPMLRPLYATASPLSRAMQANWAAFARNGAPAEPEWRPWAHGAPPYALGPPPGRELERFERARPLWAELGWGPREIAPSA